MEDLHGNLLLTLIELLQFGVFDGDIRLDVLARQGDLFIPARTVDTDEGPVTDSGGCTAENEHEEIGLEAPIFHDWKEGLEDVGNDDEKSSEVVVVEGAISFSKTDQGSVFDSGVVGGPHSGGGHVGLRERRS